MGSTTRRLFEIVRELRDDQRGEALLKELFDACFDQALAMWQWLPEGLKADPAPMRRLAAVLERVNTYLAESRGLTEGIFAGTGPELAAWAEDVTLDVLEHRPYLTADPDPAEDSAAAPLHQM